MTFSKGEIHSFHHFEYDWVSERELQTFYFRDVWTGMGKITSLGHFLFPMGHLYKIGVCIIFKMNLGPSIHSIQFGCGILKLVIKSWHLSYRVTIAGFQKNLKVYKTMVHDTC